MCLAGIELEIRSLPEREAPAVKTPVPAPLTPAEPRTIRLNPPQAADTQTTPSVPALGRPRLACLDSWRTPPALTLLSRRQDIFDNA